MGLFTKRLEERNPDPNGRRWLFVPYDQLSDRMGPLAREDPRSLGIVLVETTWKGNRRPYHKQKLALILANLRHFALEQADRGVAVKHVVAETPYHTVLLKLAKELGPMRVMTPAERELREDLKGLIDLGSLIVIPHEGWLTTSEQFRSSVKKGPAWRMDRFYRRVRQHTGILMKKGKPVGGKFSFDSENRLPWKGKPIPPAPPSFPVDPLKEEVSKLIERKFSHHPGRLDIKALPGTAKEAEKLWSWAKRESLPQFGPYEDAMTVRSTGLFHSRISGLLNIHRLLPSRIIGDVLDTDIPLPSKEGFIRQVLGWREFVYHVHSNTDGFRKLPGENPPVAKQPGDGGYGTWKGSTWKAKSHAKDPDGGAKPNFLGCDAPLPPAFWGETSGLFCLDHVVSCVWAEGYSHHITRLMILANIATLLGISPRELTDWFWVAYTDAYDWVVEPNVIGMGTYGLGDLMITKPYVSGAAYINKMSDYCGSCIFDPKKNCPISNLYWAFLKRHEKALQDNPRMKLVLASLGKRPENRQGEDHRIYGKVKDLLASGEVLTPKALGV
jgi:deoxyribodipyrimidine photolyase-related protein